MPKSPEVVLAKGTVLRPGDIVKVRYKLTPEEQPDWHAIQASIKEALVKYKVEVHLVQPETSLIKERSVFIRSAGTKSDEQVVTEFGKQKKLPELTMRAGMTFLEKA